MIYVASPYSHKKDEVRELRYQQVKQWTFERIKDMNESLFAPIAYTHEYAKQYGMPTDAAFWYKFNLGFIENCVAMYVLQLPEWEKSVGVLGEIELAMKLSKPVKYFPWASPHSWTI